MQSNRFRQAKINWFKAPQQHTQTHTHSLTRTQISILTAQHICYTPKHTHVWEYEYTVEYAEYTE